MKVTVCRDRKTGETVDVLDHSVHLEVTPDTLKTFDCTDEEWDEKEFHDLKYIISPTALSDASLEDIQAELVKRNEMESFDTMLQASLKQIKAGRL